VLSAGSLVAVIGFWDDRRSLSPAVRLAGQLLAACLLVYFLGLPRRIDLGLLRIDSAYLAAFLVVIGVVWLINLANFMDGIDGLAGAECVFVMATRSALLYWCGDRGATYIGFAVAAAALGFLFLNWSPARIFMGDVGSGYIGLLYAALMLSDTIANPSGLWVWLILLAAFLVDSTVTLIRRLKAGQRVWQAHRTHAYQNAALRWGHARTTVAFILVDIFWLAPLAFCAAKWHNLGSSLFVVATAPLVAIVWRLGAGVQKTAAPGKVPYLDLISAALLRE
jgi:Fuc2NAc and GlcNAc transferase